MKPLPCRRLLALLSDYLDRELDPALCRRLEAHMPECRPCVTLLKTLRRTRSLLRSRRPAQVPAASRARLLARLRAASRAVKA